MIQDVSGIEGLWVYPTTSDSLPARAVINRGCRFLSYSCPASQMRQGGLFGFARSGVAAPLVVSQRLLWTFILNSFGGDLYL